MKFKQYYKRQLAELRSLEDYEIDEYKLHKKIRPHLDVDVLISQEALDSGSPKPGDMIARNPKNTVEQWLVTKEDFLRNFEANY